ncbi:MAG: hypothetical protein WC641_05770 [Patescibacteria group bacterium]
MRLRVVRKLDIDSAVARNEPTLKGGRFTMAKKKAKKKAKKATKKKK